MKKFKNNKIFNNPIKFISIVVFVLVVLFVITIGLFYIYKQNLNSKQPETKQKVEKVNQLTPEPSSSVTTKDYFYNYLRANESGLWSDSKAKLVNKKEIFDNNNGTLTYTYKSPELARFKDFSITYPDYWNLYLEGPVEKGEFVPYGGEYDLLFEDPKTGEYIGIYRIRPETPYCSFKWQTYYYCEVEESNKVEFNMGKFYFTEHSGNDQSKVWSLCEEIPKTEQSSKNSSPCINKTPTGSIYIYTYFTGDPTELPSYLVDILNSIKVLN